MKPICYKCRRFFRPKKNGLFFLEGMPIDGETRAEPGLAEPERWKPYKLWQGDLWECQGCGTEIIHGTGFEPFNEHYKKDFEEEVLRRCGEKPYQVNDC